MMNDITNASTLSDKARKALEVMRRRPSQSGTTTRQEEQPGLHSGDRLFAQTDA